MQKWDEQARLFLEKAKEDESAIELLARADHPLIGIIGFHAQQSIEKRLKALLSYRRLAFPATHDLDRLMDLLAASGLEIPVNVGDAAILTPYGVHWRYDSLLRQPPPDDELMRILQFVQAVRDWTLACMR